ncbi:hypothetical protein PVAND_004634 [Polypedilum vanderplanki]|uniref:Uncharacterized protein n=1 Tax=Polypedilum vanderplanki TaxID=319348 RepID=A0A9J6BY55_POLVA|nr:hypothetical protein PVAND_004634 [Polypedilum vanderplanki]
MNIKIALTFFIVFYLATYTLAFGGGRSSGSAAAGSRGGYSNVGGQRSRSGANYPYGMPGIGNEFNSNLSKKSKEIQPKATGRNISTLQIVFILTLIMTLGFAGYYFIQFYPFLCSKESKYDVMDRRTSVTPTHSREFEYDESTSSATKSTNASYSNEHDV